MIILQLITYRKIGVVVLIGLPTIAIVWLTASAGGQGSPVSILMPLLLPIGVAVLFLVPLRPVIAAIAVLGFAFMNPSLLPPVAELGELSIRYVDIFFGLLVFGVFIRMLILQRTLVSWEFGKIFAPIFLFLLYIGISLVWVWFYDTNFLSASLASYLRLILTSLYALIFHLALVNKRDVAIFHKVLIAFCIASIAIGLWETLSGARFGVETAVGQEVGFSGRAAGLLGVNSLGLVSGLLVLYAFVKKDNRMSNPKHWMLLFIIGLLGLFLAKSASSILAAAGSVAFYTVAYSKRIKLPNLLRWATAGTLALAGAASAILFLRQADVLGLRTLSGGSFAQRLMIAYGGFRIFLEHPLLGIGWQASATEAFIGSYDLNIALMERFLQLPEHYFFLTKPTSLHNMYIQFLAELGIIGFALFVYTCFRVGKVILRIIRNIHPGSPYESWAIFYTFGLIFLLIWWNTNPFFGGQTESILAFIFLALLASIARLCKVEMGKG